MLPVGTLFCVIFVGASIIELLVAKDSAQQVVNNLVWYGYKRHDRMDPLHILVLKNAPTSQKERLHKREQMPP